MNLAQLWKLPVIYVCENNLYTEYTHFSETTAGDIAAAPPHSESKPKRSTDRTFAPFTKPPAVSSIARGAGDGPAFLLCNTYRYHGHHVGDINREYYRSKQEEQHWKTQT